MTPCGHSFCRSCAGDAVTRKHCCPVCQVGVIGGEAGLIRNFMVDEVTSTLRKATEDTDVAYMRLLFDTAAGGTAGADAAKGKGKGDDRDHPHVGSDDARFPTGFPRKPPFSAGNSPGEAQTDQNQPLRRGVLPSPAGLSPVEEVLVRRMREAFLGYQSYYARERAAHAAEVSDLTAQLSAVRREETTPRQGQAETRARRAAALQGAIDESEARFNAGMEALLRDFDAHAAAALPPPSLLPCTVTLIVASRGVRFDTQLLPTHFPENIYGKVLIKRRAELSSFVTFDGNGRQPIRQTYMLRAEVRALGYFVPSVVCTSMQPVTDFHARFLQRLILFLTHSGARALRCFRR